MSLLSCLFGFFKRKDVGEKARKNILLGIKDIRKIFGYPHFNNKERYAYETLRYLHKLIVDPTPTFDEMTLSDRKLYDDFCRQAMKYSDYVVSSLVSKGGVEELEEEFIKVSNSEFTSYSMPFEAYQKLKNLKSRKLKS